MNNLNSQIDLWLNNQITNLEVIDYLIEEEKKGLTNYELSLNYLLMGRAYLADENSKTSIEFFEKSIDFATRANKKKESSDNYRVISEAGSYIMLQKGIPYIIKNSKDINDQALRSLELDKDNIRSSIIVANGLINAPKFFGGDINQGISILESLDTNQWPKEVEFDRLIALSNAYEKKKSKNNAINSAKLALRIYPNNKKAKELLLTLEG